MMLKAIRYDGQIRLEAAAQSLEIWLGVLQPHEANPNRTEGQLVESYSVATSSVVRNDLALQIPAFQVETRFQA